MVLRLKGSVAPSKSILQQLFRNVVLVFIVTHVLLTYYLSPSSFLIFDKNIIEMFNIHHFFSDQLYGKAGLFTVKRSIFHKGQHCLINNLNIGHHTFAFPVLEGHTLKARVRHYTALTIKNPHAAINIERTVTCCK